jgi:hypothetical protein
MRVLRLITCVILLSAVCAAGYSTDLTVTEKSLSPELSSISELRIITKPVGAEVYLDGKFYGTSELVISAPQYGPVKIELKKPGFKPFNADLRITKNSLTTVEAVLTPYSGILIVDVFPDEARIFADKTPIEQGRNELPVGLYRVSAQKAGYRPYAGQVRIFAGIETTFSAELTPLPPAAENDRTETDFKPGGPAGLRLIESAEALQPRGFLAATGLAVRIADNDVFLPFSAGLRLSIISGLDFSGSFNAVFSTETSAGTSWTAETGLKYLLNPDGNIFFAAAGLSARFGGPDGLSFTAAAPMLFRLNPGGPILEILLGPEVTAAPFREDGSPAETGLFSVAGAAGFSVNLEFLRIDLSGKMSLTDIEGSTAAELHFMPEGSPVVLSGFSQLDFSAADITAGVPPVFSAGAGITLSGF